MLESIVSLVRCGPVSNKQLFPQTPLPTGRGIHGRGADAVPIGETLEARHEGRFGTVHHRQLCNGFAISVASVFLQFLFSVSTTELPAPGQFSPA